MSNIDKQALRERYSPKPAPECHICGKEMTIQRMSASRITYGCTGATYDDKGCHYAEGRSIADDHYEQSRVTVVDVSDPDVLALLDELEHYKSREERVTKLVLDNSTSWDALYKKLEAAEKRIAELDKRLIEYAGIATREAHRVAELEARDVNLSKLSVGEVMHMSGFSRDYAEGWCAGNDNAIHEIRAAGIGVKGE
ncbi:ead/Ea22-like family protein [Salmonella enterica subsp. enterica]|nr:ead/Ea22-like family protein [Salmonella enterica subsp. enterica]